MSDYIKRENALNAFNNAFYAGLTAKINKISSEDVEPIRHGHWIKIDPAGIYECSECGKNVMTSDIEAYEHCHGCGARMDDNNEQSSQKG